MTFESIVIAIIGLFQVLWVFMVSQLFQKIDKLENEKQDKTMCAQKSAEIEKALGRGDAKFLELMQKFDKFSDIFSKMETRLALAVQQLEGMEKRRKTSE